MNGGPFQGDFEQFVDFVARERCMAFLDAFIRDANELKVELFFKLSQDIFVSLIDDLDELIKPEAVAI